MHTAAFRDMIYTVHRLHYATEMQIPPMHDNTMNYIWRVKLQHFSAVWLQIGSGRTVGRPVLI